MKSRSAPESQHPETTDDAILGGRLRLLQPRTGHRVGHDAILLAAATSAQKGDHVVDLGAGVGAAGLALLARVPEATVTLIEIDPALAALAAENIGRNGLDAHASVKVLDVTAPRDTIAAAGLKAGSANHVMMNPPFNDAARQSISPDPRRRAAHVAEPASLSAWVETASWLLHPAGTLTLIWRADGLADVLAAITPIFGAVTILPIQGRAGQPAIRMIVRANKATQATLSQLPNFSLNDPNGRPTAEAENVLRHVAVLPIVGN